MPRDPAYVVILQTRKPQRLYRAVRQIIRAHDAH